MFSQDNNFSNKNTMFITQSFLVDIPKFAIDMISTLICNALFYIAMFPKDTIMSSQLFSIQYCKISKDTSVFM